MRVNQGRPITISLCAHRFGCALGWWLLLGAGAPLIYFNENSDGQDSMPIWKTNVYMYLKAIWSFIGKDSWE